MRGAVLADRTVEVLLVDDDGAHGPATGSAPGPGPAVPAPAAPANAAELPELSVGDVQVAEGDAGTTTARFVVTLSHASEQAVEVTATTRDGAATASSDYRAFSGVVRVPNGRLSAQVPILVLGDAVDEGNEDFELVLSDPHGATLGRDVGQALIEDDDGPRDLALEALGSADREARPGEIVPLQVRALSRGGRPAAHVAVTWQSTAAGELLDGPATSTDEGGVATQRVRVDSGPGTVSVVAHGGTGDRQVTFQITVGSPPGGP